MASASSNTTLTWQQPVEVSSTECATLGYNAHPVRAAAAATIPRRVIDSGLIETGDCCGACLGEYEVGEAIAETRCAHHFHVKCLYNWLPQDCGLYCPQCREAILDETLHQAVVEERVKVQNELAEMREAIRRREEEEVELVASALAEGARRLLEQTREAIRIANVAKDWNEVLYQLGRAELSHRWLEFEQLRRNGEPTAHIEIDIVRLGGNNERHFTGDALDWARREHYQDTFVGTFGWFAGRISR